MATDTQEQGKRLLSVIKSLKISRQEFADTVGLRYVFLSHLITGYRRITDGTAYKITMSFPAVNMEWIFTGQGEWAKPVDGHLNTVAEPPPHYERADTITLQSLPDIIRRLRQQLEQHEGRISELEQHFAKKEK